MVQTPGISILHCIFNISNVYRCREVLWRPRVLSLRISMDRILQTAANTKMWRNMSSKITYVFQRDVNYMFFDWDYCNYDWINSLASLRVFAAQAAR
ncbi:hypothetical protein C0J52_09831 [Blattella germanica]|nr:hypothetical protein C0J52_09831 [Blattella germanica]